MHEYARLVKIHEAMGEVRAAEPETLAEALYEFRKSVEAAMDGFEPFCKFHPRYAGLRRPRTECPHCWSIWMLWGGGKGRKR